MKKLIFILLFIPCFLQAQTTYYVRATGGNDANTGVDSTTNALATIAHAVTHCSSGDKVFVCSGTHTVSASISIGVGISIEGNGSSSLISSSVNSEWTFTFNLSSASEGTNGNQSISYIAMDGNETAFGAIQINARSNVEIHHCYFYDFDVMGVTFNGKVALYDPGAPTTYATGNKFYDNIMINCAEFVYQNYGNGNLQLGGQDGMLIYNDSIVATARTLGYNGYPIKYFNEGYNRGIKIYNCYLEREAPSDLGNTWNFAIESWNFRGGIEIYGNRIVGGIDLGGGQTTQGAYDYAVYIHNNDFGYDVLQNNNTPTQNAGIYFERQQDGPVLVRYNIFRRLSIPFAFFPSATDHVNNIYIEYNICDTIGDANSTSSARGMTWSNVDDSHNTVTVDNFNFNNNVLYCGETGAVNGLQLLGNNVATDVTIRNNIIRGFQYVMSNNMSGGSSIDRLSIENNIFYDNDNSITYFGTSPTNNTTQNNLTSDPLFVDLGDDYALQAGSPAIDAGIGVGATVDYAGNAVGISPDIGAYEYDGTPPDPPGLPEVTTTAITSYYSIVATGAGNVTSDGGGTITARGVCWGTSANPTTSNSKFNATGTTGAFTGTMRGLAGGTTYHYRAFVTNESGTAYGEDREITTPAYTPIINAGKLLRFNGKTLIVK